MNAFPSKKRISNEKDTSVKSKPTRANYNTDPEEYFIFYLMEGISRRDAKFEFRWRKQIVRCTYHLLSLLQNIAPPTDLKLGSSRFKTRDRNLRRTVSLHGVGSIRARSNEIFRVKIFSGSCPALCCSNGDRSRVQTVPTYTRKA